MRSWLPVLTCALAAIAIGCGTRELDPHADAASGVGGSTGIGVDAGGMVRADAAPRPDMILPIWIDPCGNGLVETGEECDDGNHIRGDGCSAICQIECHSTCRWCGMPGPCDIRQICGDGRLDPGEECDDANLFGNDGCSPSCFVDPGWICPVPGRRCAPICGDGRVVGFETCDDGNQVPGDGCSDICLVEPNDARCGDGFVSGAEWCDDGASGSAFGGYGFCKRCQADQYCGDGVTNGPEQCDLGAGNNTSGYGTMSGCAPGCVFPHFCGDAIVDADEGEQCDFGPKNGYHDGSGYSACTIDCKILIP